MGKENLHDGRVLHNRDNLRRFQRRSIASISSDSISVRASTLAHSRGPMARATARPSRPIRKLVGSPMTPYDFLMAPAGSRSERHGEAELAGVLPNGPRLFPEVQREDRESARSVVAVKLLEDRQLGTALEAPARPEIQQDDTAPQALQR